jgi:RHS repeat-associated protein
LTPTTTTCDALSRRIARYEDGVRTAGWLYLDSLRPVAELNAANEVTSVFIYGGDGHAPSVMRRGGETYRFITDHLGSVRVVVRMSDGEVVERTDYDAWGRIVATPIQTPGFRQPFGFAGGLHDRVTGMVHFGAREYDPVTGRWMQKDPIRFAGGDTNIYAYVGGDPVGRVDSMGLEPDTPSYDDWYFANELKWQEDVRSSYDAAARRVEEAYARPGNWRSRWNLALLLREDFDALGDWKTRGYDARVESAALTVLEHYLFCRDKAPFKPVWPLLTALRFLGETPLQACGLNRPDFTRTSAAPSGAASFLDVVMSFQAVMDAE